MTELSWRCVSASVVGTSHTATGLECQDNHLCREIQTARGRVLLAIVSDGAGSAAKSAVGSQLLCEVLLDKTLEFFREQGDVHQLNLRLIANWVQFFRDEITLQAEADGLSDRDYACTLLGVIVGEQASAFFQVGDGAIVYSTASNDQVPILAFWPERGEYENTTFFVTQATFLDQLQFSLIPEQIVEVALLSDGLQRLALNYQTKSAHQPFFAGFFAPLRHTTRQDIPALNVQLANYLNSPRVNERTDDDKTLILATSLGNECCGDEI
jgi:Protein phosphatase 2C